MSKQEWAVILGASSGTGAAIARAVADDPGLNVFGAHRGRYADGAQEVSDAIAAAGLHGRQRTAARRLGGDLQPWTKARAAARCPCTSSRNESDGRFST